VDWIALENWKEDEDNEDGRREKVLSYEYS